MTPLAMKLARELAARMHQKTDETPAARGDFSAYIDDPVGFARDAFYANTKKEGCAYLWDKQAEIALALVGSDRVAVKSGHKIGKTRLAAILAWWWVMTRANARVIMTSASDRQVRSILWREIKALHRLRKVDLPTPAELPGLGVQFADGREIVGFSTNEPERMAGLSGNEMLFVLDEASGIKQDIFDAIEGNLAGGGKVLMLSNPTQVSGYFYEAFTRARGDWKCFTISSEETPNVKEGREIIPGLATLHWLEGRKRAWGEDSPRYQVRVKGNFPTQGDDSVVGLDLILAGQERWSDTKPDGPLELGIDVARFGDDESVFAFRRGLKAEPLIAHVGLDTQKLAGRAVAECEKRRAGGRVLVKIDTIGVGGGVADALRAMRLPWMVVVDVCGSEKAIDEIEYTNRRAEMLFGIGVWLKAGGAIPKDDELEVELSAMRYKFDPKGRMQVESKDDIKKRLGRSPDRADALALAVASPRPVAQTPRRHIPGGMVA